MEKRITSLVFRRITENEFKAINDEQKKGGGFQGYIDFPMKRIPLNSWFDFLGKNTGDVAQGPSWTFPINSFGLNASQKLKIYQRRSASVSVASQKIHSKKANRVLGWHPNHSFPTHYDPATENLVIYIVKTNDNQFWAGWFLKNDIPKEWAVNDNLRQLFTEDSAGYIRFRRKLFIETNNAIWPFYFTPNLIENQTRTDEDLQEELTEEDTSVKLRDMDNLPAPVKERLTKIRARNTQLVKDLKKLYKGKCQFTEDTYTFRKKDGEFYSEVHHLIPLGEEGSDSYANAVVVSPLIHRMLHYANVSPIDLSKIKNNQLQIQMDDKDFTVTWHANHLKTVNDSLED